MSQKNMKQKIIWDKDIENKSIETYKPKKDYVGLNMGIASKNKDLNLSSKLPSEVVNIKKPEIKPITKTYYKEFEKVTASKKGSAMAEIIEKARMKEFKKEVKSPRTKRNIFFIIMSIALILLGVLALAWLFLTDKIENRIIKKKTVPSIVYAESHTGLDITELSPIKTKLLIKKGLGRGTPDDSIENFYYIKKENDIQRQIGIKELLDATESKTPELLYHNIGNNFMHGIYSAGNEYPFIILKADSYDRAFDGMKEWEKTIVDDLSVYLNLPKNVTERSISDDKFEDAIIKNKVSRITRFVPKENISLNQNYFSKALFSASIAYAVDGENEPDLSNIFLCPDDEELFSDQYGTYYEIIPGDKTYCNISTATVNVADSIFGNTDDDFWLCKNSDGSIVKKEFAEQNALCWKSLTELANDNPNTVCEEEDGTFSLPEDASAEARCFTSLNKTLKDIKDVCVEIENDDGTTTEYCYNPVICKNSDGQIILEEDAVIDDICWASIDILTMGEVGGIYLCVDENGNIVQTGEQGDFGMCFSALEYETIDNSIICRNKKGILIPYEERTPKDSCYPSLSEYGIICRNILGKVVQFGQQGLGGVCQSTTSDQFWSPWSIERVRGLLRAASGTLNTVASLISILPFPSIQETVVLLNGWAYELYQLSTLDILDIEIIEDILQITQMIETIIIDIDNLIGSNSITGPLHTVIDILKEITGFAHSLTWITLNGTIEHEKNILLGDVDIVTCEVQIILAYLELHDEEIDFESCIYDETTQDAIITFQKLNCLKETGILDGLTIEIINEIIEAGGDPFGPEYSNYCLRTRSQEELEIQIQEIVNEYIQDTGDSINPDLIDILTSHIIDTGLHLNPDLIDIMVFYIIDTGLYLNPDLVEILIDYFIDTGIYLSPELVEILTEELSQLDLNNIETTEQLEIEIQNIITDYLEDTGNDVSPELREIMVDYLEDNQLSLNPELVEFNTKKIQNTGLYLKPDLVDILTKKIEDSGHILTGQDKIIIAEFLTTNEDNLNPEQIRVLTKLIEVDGYIPGNEEIEEILKLLQDRQYCDDRSSCIAIYNQLKRNLENGMAGDDIRDLQVFLYSQGYNIKSMNGVYETNTYDAVSSYQTDNGLQVTGIVDTRTRASINSVIMSDEIIGSGYILNPNGFLSGTGNLSDEKRGLKIPGIQKVEANKLKEGDVILLYTFLDEKTILITTHEAVIPEIIERKTYSQIIN